MAEIISPATEMLASQRAKKVSMTEDEPALTAWITEVVETLSRPAGYVKVAKHHVTKVKDQLSDLRENGDEVEAEQLEGLFETLAKDAAVCRRLKPDVFALLVEVLLETSESKVRERGFYILAKSLHEESFDARDSFTGRLHEIGRGCLVQLYERFVEKTVAYGSRRWMGSLLMELIRESEENQQDVAMMSTSKRARLGSAVLYESSEIIRAISGRILAVMLGADHEARSFFPTGTSEKLFKDYPGSTQSGSQWDKAFQAYVDEIWKAIEAYNEYSGELRFAQHVATVPSHPAIESGALARNRSIYIETSDSVRVYMHLGNEHFDSALDIPLTSIEGIDTTITLVDQSQSKEYVDIVLRLKPSAYCFVNSTHASLFIVRLTVESQEIADGVRDGIIRSLAAITGENNAKSQIMVTPSTRTNTQESSQSKKSYGDEDLILNGSYEPKVVNDSFVAMTATMNVSGVATIEEDPFIASVHEARSIMAEVTQLPQEYNAATDVTGKYAAESGVARKQPLLLRTAVELDVLKDIDTGEVLSSKVLGMVVVPNVTRRPSVMAARPMTEVAIEQSGNGHQINLFSSADGGPEVVETVATPPPQKQVIEPKAPAEDSHDQSSNSLTAESVVVEKITAPINQQTFESQVSADNKGPVPAFATQEGLTAAEDAVALVPKKQDLRSKAPEKAGQGQVSGDQEEKPLELEEKVISSAKKQSLKAKTPIEAVRRKDDKAAELKQCHNKPPKTLRLEPEPQALSPIEKEACQNTKLVAPSKKKIKATRKGSGEGNFSKQTLPSDADDEDIYDFIPSPPKAEKNTKPKGKKATATTSFKGYGKKSRANDQLLWDEVEEAVTITKPSKLRKEPSKKKLLRQPVVAPPATAAAPKRITAPRSTKGKKSMKDLSDSEIENDELLIFAESKERKGSTTPVKTAKAANFSVFGQEAGESKIVVESAPSQQASQDTTTVMDLGKEMVGIDAEDAVLDHSEVKQKALSKSNVAKTAIIEQSKVNRDPTVVNTQRTKQWPSASCSESSPLSQIDDGDSFNDPEHSGYGDIALPSAPGLQKLTGTTVEARIGRKMAEILGLASAKAKKPQQKQQFSDPPKGAEPLAAVLETVRYADEFDNSMSAPSSKNGSEALMEHDECEGNGFFVLSSPRNLTQDVTTAALHKEHSSADDPIVLSDPEEEEEDNEDDDDEEESVAQVPFRKAVKKYPVIAPVVEVPAKRHRGEKEASLSSPPQTRIMLSSERAARKVKAQARRLVVQRPGSSSHMAATSDVAAASEAASSIDPAALLDDHHARKAPLISFGPHGPRNQGLSSAVKSARVLNEEKPNTLSAIMDNLSMKSIEKMPSPAKHASNAAAKSHTRTPCVPSFEDSLARYDIAMDIQLEEDDGLTFLDAGQSVASSRSHSRVDVNGSPKPRRVPLSQLGGRRRASQIGFRSDIGSTTSLGPKRYTAPAEKASSRTTFEDDTTLFGSGLFISSNRKARPAAPDDDLDFESRYTPHHAAKNGDYVGVVDLKVVDAAPAMADPFLKKVKMQDSDFAQRLRLSQTFKDRDDKFQEPPTTKAQPRFQAPAKMMPIQSHLSSVSDADATLVDIENLRPQHRQWKQYHASSSDSSDIEAEAYEDRYEAPPPNPQQIWKEALKPHQKDVSDVLHHVVDGLLQQLFDTEPAVHAIADEYRANGSKIVEALKIKMDAEIQGLYHRSTSTIESLATTLRRSRAALHSESGADKALDDQYRQWRARQHTLQLLPFMAREVGGRG